jgi:hypothetical protein
LPHSGYAIKQSQGIVARYFRFCLASSYFAGHFPIRTKQQKGKTALYVSSPTNDEAHPRRNPVDEVNKKGFDYSEPFCSPQA